MYNRKCNYTVNHFIERISHRRETLLRKCRDFDQCPVLGFGLKSSHFSEVKNVA